MSVEPARRDLTVWRGSTFAKRFTYLETVDPRVVKDLTGYTAELRVFDDGTTIVYPCTVDGVDGAIDLVLDAEDTYTAWRGANYELKLIEPAATAVYTLLYGTIRSKGQATA